MIQESQIKDDVDEEIQQLAGWVCVAIAAGFVALIVAGLVGVRIWGGA